MKTSFSCESPVGRLFLAEENGALTDLCFGPIEDSIPGETPLLQSAVSQLQEYFGGKRRDFDLPLDPRGTSFQVAVWSALRTIPYAETRAYRDIAAAVGRPKGFRAVGLANNRNPISIIVPCHRVVGADGSLVGYGGGLDTKRFLLDLEKKYG